MKRLALVALLALVGAGASPAEAAAHRYAYYLFLAGPPQGCEDCYVPLLVVRRAVEDVAAVSIHPGMPIPDKKSLEDLIAAFRGQH